MSAVSLYIIFLSLSNCVYEVHLKFCPLFVSFLEFRKGNAPILVATDVASRGLGLSPFVLLVNQIYFTKN